MISVIVPVYNVKEYVIKCLDSLKNQTLKDIEVIVVDDGSTDGSGELVEDFCVELDNFHVFHKENGGLMSAWTYGVEQSNGDYIGFVDSDDYVAEKMYAVLYEKATESNADIVMCDRFDVNGDIIREQFHGENSLEEGLYFGESMNRIKLMVFPLPGTPELTKARWNKLFKRSLLFSNMKYCQCLSKTFEDRYITPPCVFSAERFYYVRQPLYYYVHRDGSNSGMYKPDLLDQIKRLYYVEKQALEDKEMMEQFGQNWEYVFIDYIRQYVTRNIKNVKGFEIRFKSARKLLNDDLVKERLKQYGRNDKTRLVRAVYLSYKLKCPVLLTIVSYFCI